MSSYGAIGVDENDTDPLIVEESRNERRRAVSLSESTVPHRQPYLFTGGLGLSREGSTASLQDENREQNMALRYRLYSRLDPGGRQLLMPAHVFPSEVFSILPFDELKDQSGKQNSIVTIFSIWNTMMGTSLLAMPWALQQAGFAFGLILILGMAALCFYTAYIVVQSPKGLSHLGIDSASAEFTDVCKVLLGKYGEMSALVFSVLVLLGGVFVYWVLMSNFLYYTGNVFYEALQPNSSTIPIMENRSFTCDVFCPKEFEKRPEEVWYNLVEEMTETAADSTSTTFDKFWSLQGTVPIYLAILLFPLLNFKSPTFFTKFNVLGTGSVMYLLVFTFSKLLECGVNLDFHNKNSIHYAALFNWKFPALTGTLTLSYFIHNAVLTILRNQKNPENNARDLSIGYGLVAFCYVFIATCFYTAFPVERTCISDNFLNNFGSGDVLSSVARVFLLFQMITVLPLLVYLIRTQVFYAIYGETWPGLWKVILLNICVMLLAVSIAVFYPRVGSILRYVGAFSGLLYVFALPCLVYMTKRRLEGTLTQPVRYIHTAIVAAGLVNLIAQFVI
ncbi:hypothetical protein WR25_07247 [Diploscapter pachys]|uniref:Amino acid transporter transmembrane domain-containing protein n=1 Tax=Diploscapter pachys TaxID=2018661 RepID=A0A2A2L8C9_9BILA|nr:hypothetical protein WR25_07247 [Diploscapter pachys]